MSADVLSNLLAAVSMLLHYVFTIYMWLIIIRALLTWVNPDPYNPIVQFLYKATEPVLQKVRRKVPYLGGIDFSPMIVIFVLIFLDSFLVSSLHDIAIRLKTGGGF